MAKATVLEFNKLPSTLPTFVKAATAKKTGLKEGKTIPPVTASVKNLPIDLNKLQRYRKVCGFPGGKTVPAPFLHIYAAPLHMALLTSEQFPLQLLGLVHIRNSMTQHRPVLATEKLNITVKIDGHRETALGIEFDIISQVHVGDELVWDSVSTNLSRKKSGAKKGGKKAPAKLAPLKMSSKISIPAGTGRKYGAVAGDVNPIHLFDATAKAFGFKKAIIHGMWTLAKSAAILDSQLPRKFRYDVEFKLPIFMPAKVQLQYSNSNEAISMRVMDSKGAKPHMNGHIEFLD
jgi:acyl dehydratase